MINNHGDAFDDASWLTRSLSQPSSSSSSPPRPPPSEYTPLTSTTHLSADTQTILNLKKMKKHVDPSWLTLSQPSSSPPLPKPFPSEWTPSSPPRPPPFEYTPLTPSTRPIDPQTFFYSELITSLPRPPNFDSNPNNLALIPKLPFHYHQEQEQDLSPPTNKVLGRRQRILPKHQPVKKRRLTKSMAVPPPFPWATSKRAILHTLDHMLSVVKLNTISGTLECKVCKFQQDIQFDLVENFEKVTRFIEERRNEMCDRAPVEWMNPVIPNCKSCGQEKAMHPLMTKKRNINWLFLLLGQMIGCCNLDQLKYFCKHADIHRTGAKNRLIYSTYFGLCKQLQPNTPFLP
ncbi:hypothetical protein MtrunA17_Chr7g0263201 [Medicago truncatula]|uniref:DUF7086 domain-containing protein n=1 Tax=Medicago truncatula TaxID=3880 RepID=A0A396H6J3_MEDTR|nr:uncharacterized protein LOC25499301 [Medicago truncatula]RHN48383.1 hypothetical protein MtrunA17_Chr7g0263201 [Medicago truncatula]